MASVLLCSLVFTKNVYSFMQKILHSHSELITNPMCQDKESGYMAAPIKQLNQSINQSKRLCSNK